MRAGDNGAVFLTKNGAHRSNVASGRRREKGDVLPAERRVRRPFFKRFSCGIVWG